MALKGRWYCFYKDYIVHYWAIDDFSYADFWLREQGDKPRYIPDKTVFLLFSDEYYEQQAQTDDWNELFDFVTVA